MGTQIRKREAPSLFDQNARMIGRDSSNGEWKEFIWGTETDCTWEYAPETIFNMYLLGTRMTYTEIEINKVVFIIPFGKVYKEEASDKLLKAMKEYNDDVDVDNIRGEITIYHKNEI